MANSPPRKTRKNGIRGEEKKALQDQFLQAYEAIATISGAAQQVGIHRATHYGWLADDPDYAVRFEEADEGAVQRLEQEARRRALVGTNEPVFYKGEQCGTVKKYSDVLLIFLLKARRPDVYRERFDHRVSSADPRPLVIDLVTNRESLTAAKAAQDLDVHGPDESG